MAVLNPSSPATYCPHCGVELQRLGPDAIDVCPEHGVMEGSGVPTPPRVLRPCPGGCGRRIDDHVEACWRCRIAGVSRVDLRTWATAADYRSAVATGGDGLIAFAEAVHAAAAACAADVSTLRYDGHGLNFVADLDDDARVDARRVIITAP